MKNNILGIVVALLTTIIMIFLGKTDAYKDAIGNGLFLFLLLFAMVMLGFGLAKLFNFIFDDKPKIKFTKKKNDFIMSDEDIGRHK